MDNTKAKKFGQDWIKSWNNHDIDSILSHYDESIEFYSPFIPLLKFNELGVIKGKVDLKKYFEIGLKSYPELYFNFHNCFIGINTIVLHYTSVNNRIATEVFEFNEQNKVIKVYCNYLDSN